MKKLKRQAVGGPAYLINGPAVWKADRSRFWNMASISEDEGEIVLYGDIAQSRPTDWWTGEPLQGQYITPEGFLEDLEAVKNKKVITVRINSRGGDLNTGIAIHNILTALPGTVNTVVDGLAASAASVIAMAGQRISAYRGSLLMIHGVGAELDSFYQIGDLRKLVDCFDASERAIAEIYSARTGIDVEEIRSMMDAETWMTGSEAVERGFVQELLERADQSIEMSADHRILLVNGISHDLSGFKNVPTAIDCGRIQADTGIQTGTGKQTNIENAKRQGTKVPEGGSESMTMDEFRQTHPDLAAQFDAQLTESREDGAKQGAAKERQRLAAIETIEAAIGDKELVNEAKFGSLACTAEQLSFRAMQKHAQNGIEFLNHMKADMKGSGAAEVGAVPTAKDPELGGAAGKGLGDSTPEDIAAVVNAYKAIKKTEGKA